jgi:hypothetical protein
MLAGMAVPGAAHATPMTYSFVGVAGTGSVIDLGSGPVDVSGFTFTASGHTLNDIDLFNSGTVDDSFGSFAATTAYDFDVAGVFTTNIGGDFYIQEGLSPASVDAILLTDFFGVGGFRDDLLSRRAW